MKSILVVSTEPFIPWEIVHVKEPGKPLSKETLFLARWGSSVGSMGVGRPTGS